MNISKKTTYFFLFIILFVIYSCDKNRIYEENKALPEKGWEAEKPISFEFEVKDTVYFYNLYLNVRNAGAYSFSNLFLFVTTAFPKGQISKDTAECTLANPEGKWLGKGLGDLWDNQFLFKKEIRFPQIGKYKISLQHGMRVAALTQIMDVGIRVEKAPMKP